MKLKSILKSIKLNESLISMILGSIVIVVVGVLVVNYFSAQDTGDTLPTGETVTSDDGQTIIRDGMTYHVVQPNESLWEISEKYYESGYSWTEIAESNKLSNPNEIEKGDELLIPDLADEDLAGEVDYIEPEQAEEPTPTPEPAEELAQEVTEDTDEPISGATYTVEKGDTLWDISVRAYGDGYRWTDIAEANDLVNPNLIHKGNVFVLPR